MQRLDEIEISGFKSIRILPALRLNMLNVLIGANGAGKSNFVGLFKLLNQIVEGRLQSYIGKAGGFETLLYFGRKETENIEVSLKFGHNGYNFRLAPSATGGAYFEHEICYYYGPSHARAYDRHLGSGHSESWLSDFPHLPVVKHVLEDIGSWLIYHFHDTSETAKIKRLHDLADNERLRSDGANLAAFLYLLRERHREQYRQIVATVRLVAPFFADFRLRLSPLNPDKIQLEWREKDSDAYFNTHALSDGTLRFICLATLLLQPSTLLPSTLLLDEPELGLHPFAVTLLASMLQAAATKTQLIVATQSVPLINKLQPEDVIIVDRADRQSVFKRLNSQDLELWLEDYALGEIWEKNLIGGRP